MENFILKSLLPVMMVSLGTLAALQNGQMDKKTAHTTMQNATAIMDCQAYVSKITDYESERAMNYYEFIENEINVKIERVRLLSDEKEWFISYKEMLGMYGDALDPPETIYDWFTDTELDLLFRVVQAEIGDEY